MNINPLQSLKQAHANEAHRILSWWRNHSIDEKYGGFYGEINQNNTVTPRADKGGILNARILWAYSAAYQFTKDDKDKSIAIRAYHYIRDHFYDSAHGGTFWSLDCTGKIINDRKQIYSIAFTIYGLSEYFKISKDLYALNLAISLFKDIETHSRDNVYGGYYEAYSRDWQLLEDLRLSEKDRNDPKTMNTHLHIIEAYANLYTVWKNVVLKNAIEHLLDLFSKKIIDPHTYHLSLFFDRPWNRTDHAISYGHDIEASWLLEACANSLGDESKTNYWKEMAIKIADASSEGLQADGSFIHEYDPVSHQSKDYREWWVSAEGLVGFVNAYQITKDISYLDKATRLWDFIKTYLIDSTYGEWYWGTDNQYRKLEMYKMGFWKCPYHNLRACMEVIKRMKN